jgi:hypothetical protein
VSKVVWQAEQLFESSQNPLADFVLESNLQNHQAVFA